MCVKFILRYISNFELNASLRYIFIREDFYNWPLSSDLLVTADEEHTIK